MSSKNPPNILFLFTDQLRADCIAALGNSKIKTPNIDRLVMEGTSFDRCYTPSPVCVPARHSLTSGLPPHVTGCVDNVEVEANSPSLMEKLGEHGFQTHGVGKMHFSENLGDWGFHSRDISEEIPDSNSRDDYRTFLDNNGFQHVLDPHGLRSELYYTPQPSQLPEKLHHSHWIADRSIDFLNKRDTAKPFFLWSSFIKPHPPFESPNPWGRLYHLHEMDEPLMPEGDAEHTTYWNKVQNRYKYKDGGPYDRIQARAITAAYYATISFIDYNIGRIFDALGTEIDNTLIVFSSDHGEMLGDFGHYGKRTMLDPSARVPMIARLPDHFPANQHCEHPATLLDLYPTFMDLVGNGVSRPSPEGLNLAEVLKDKAQDRIVFSQFSQSSLGLYMATNGNWKYIYSAADDKEWLYDLANDPLELVNCIQDPKSQAPLSLLKSACIERYRYAKNGNSIEGDEWKRYPVQEPPLPGTDEGLLFQDPEALETLIQALGPYARSMDFKKHPQFDLLARLCKISNPATSKNTGLETE
jgi:arylsulfatase